MSHKVDIYDTTLRDGTQAENFNLSVEDRIRISLKLDELGIDYIEGGWPGSNPSAVEFFKAMESQPLKHSKLTAFGSTRNFNNPADKDPNLQALTGFNCGENSRNNHFRQNMGCPCQRCTTHIPRG
jgi:2-isopropylmalate synthase